MTKNEQKYVNSLKEQNERVKNMLVQFIDSIGKIKNIDDVVNMALIPIMTEESQKFRAEIKAEAYKEFAERLKKESYERIDLTAYVEVSAIDDVLKELVGEDKENILTIVSVKFSNAATKTYDYEYIGNKPIKEGETVMVETEHQGIKEVEVVKVFQILESQAEYDYKKAE